MADAHANKTTLYAAIFAVVGALFGGYLGSTIGIAAPGGDFIGIGVFALLGAVAGFIAGGRFARRLAEEADRNDGP
jgi:outer membrane lipoprotein SlyB